MGQVALEGMEFYAYHGFYDEEQKIGNRYRIDLYIEADLEEAAISDDLSKTVDYEKLYQIVQREMNQPARLLEHVGHRILEGAFQEYPHLEHVKVQVSKYNPPLGGVILRSMITLERSKA
ncbi:dihydroneopterin aldolase [Rufibacter ruber]|uniref:dihydroneopterin aldolase n=1 Tax=Rufibacter ruber TaxID=1783499 RepID=UPI000836459E|nr:dihydroneopterin aldolase [Rufibacter ruber]